MQQKYRVLIQYEMSSYQHKKSQCGEKTILRPSYLRNGISYTGKTTSLYLIGTQTIHLHLHFVEIISKPRQFQVVAICSWMYHLQVFMYI